MSAHYSYTVIGLKLHEKTVRSCSIFLHAAILSLSAMARLSLIVRVESVVAYISAQILRALLESRQAKNEAAGVPRLDTSVTYHYNTKRALRLVQDALISGFERKISVNW